MEKESNTVLSVAKAVKVLATLLMIGSIMTFSGGLFTYGVLTLIFDKTTISATDLPGAFAASAMEGTADIPVARVFASYIPTFFGIFISIFFFFQLRKTAKGIEEYNGRLFYQGSHKELLKLAAIALITNLIQHMVYFGLKYFFSADTLPKNFGNAFLLISFALFIAALIFRKHEKAGLTSAENINNNGEFSPEKEYQQ
ncbi:MAG: hypothetical protein ACI4XE_09420 [Acutalibacteraceae bacterium]